MIRQIAAIAVASLVLGFAAVADTIVLKSGVRVHGKIQFQNEETVRISIGDMERTYPATNIALVEENEMTGHFDPQAALEDARKRLADLERKTGLDVKQRQEIESLLFSMQSEDSEIYDRAKQTILKFHENTAPLNKYLPYAMQTLEPNLIAGALDVFASIDTFLGARAARSHITCPAPNGRAMALTVFGDGESPDRAEILGRGMVDPDYNVRIAAARSLGKLKAKGATPLLIDAAGSGNPRLVVVANAALKSIWNTDFESQDEWQDHWNANKSSVDQPLVQLAMLPLVQPGEVYSAEE